MHVRKGQVELTSEENRERNVRRVNPPFRVPYDWFVGLLWAAEEWWCRHVTRRELYEQLDSMRILEPLGPLSSTDVRDGDRDGT